MKNINVLIVDDHSVLRSGLAQLLAGQPDITVVGEAADGQQAVDLVGERHPDVVLMDLSMPRMDGVAATGRISELYPDVHVVCLTTFGEQEKITAAIEAGAVGYLLKDTEPDELVRAVRSAAEGGAPLSPVAAQALVARVRRGSERSESSGATPSLTNREREILSLVVAGAANKAIARRLGISEKTVKGHLTNVFTRLGVSDRTQAALWAERNGITAPAV
jgi:DNA-binding NarL/FixJ family response regulator